MIRHSGIGTYLRNLLPRIVEARPSWRFTLLGPAAALGEVPGLHGSQVRLVDCDAPLYSVREQIALPRRVPRSVDLYWTPHYVIPVLLRRPMLVTVQDVFHLAMPELVGGAARRAYARLMFGAVQRRAARILFTSEFTRAEFARLVGGSRAASSVVPLGVDAGWSAAGAGAPRPLAEPYFLYVGNVKPHKNVAALVRAFVRVADRVPHHLAIVGRADGMRTGDDEVRRLVAARPDRVHLVGEVSDEALAAWMRHADAFAFPSLYEGFGLPPLEAMAAGRPCLVARAASLPEVCGDAAVYCDPRREDDIAARLAELATDPALRDALRDRGHARAAIYTWTRCAEGTIGVIEETLAA
ncbi:MAG TPA: glycosyltransferase family 1 protein [Gemmatimonadaceae bacterium]|nr:glycosyltransferase family 1 protein [Gemmatimonadaceae bacterium]